eukprot:11907679-Alexandrium_andersonii.AAC.1
MKLHRAWPNGQGNAAASASAGAQLEQHNANRKHQRTKSTSHQTVDQQTAPRREGAPAPTI